MRVGIFGGTFNPPHLGHLVCVQEAYWQLELERVVFMPVGEAPHKQIEQDPGREERCELCRLAVAGDERLAVSRHEIDKTGPAYTVETLRALRDETPGDELFFVMGSDQATSLPQWREPEQVLTLATLAVAERDEARREQVRLALAGLEGSDRMIYFPMPHIEVSSTMVRERVASGRPFRYLVSERVADRIEVAGLYRHGSAP